MALVLCPQCGEETLDQLLNCPLCNYPLAESHKKRALLNGRLHFLGLAFVGGLAAATLCNMMGFTSLALVLTATALLCLAALVLKLNTTI